MRYHPQVTDLTSAITNLFILLWRICTTVVTEISQRFLVGYQQTFSLLFVSSILGCDCTDYRAWASLM